jgi:pimeloyl-ACP methyl ester carboxylesterase
LIYQFADCELDTDLYELRRAGTPVALQRQVFDVLAFLVQHADRLVSKEELLDHIWPGKYITEGALNSRLMAARRAIGDDGERQRYIATVHRRGYRFVEQVTVAPPDEPATAKPTTAQSSPLDQTIGFCTTDDGVTLAYATSGSGTPIIKAANWLSHLEFDWDSPVWRHWMHELARERQLIRYDERGCGLSDWDVRDLSFDAWVRDLEAIVDATGVQRFALFGMSQGAAVAIKHAVMHPERVTHLVLYGSYARGWSHRAPTRAEQREREALLTLTREGWGRDNPAYRQIFASYFIPGADLEQIRWFNDLCRLSTSPENAVRFIEEFARVDVDDLLPRVSVPTLVVHATGDTRAPFEEGRRIASRIPGAKFVPVDSQNHILLEHEPAWRAFGVELERFLSRAN